MHIPPDYNPNLYPMKTTRILFLWLDDGFWFSHDILTTFSLNSIKPPLNPIQPY